MANITRTAAQVAVLYPEKAVMFSFIAAEAITAGQPVMLVAASKKVQVADANDAARDECIGLATQAAAAGQAVPVLKEGHVAGFTVGDVGTFAYVSDDLGELADAAGTAPLPVGMVVPLTDAPTLTKVLYVDVQWAFRDFVDNT